ncbi:MAG: hypothetical protein VX780_01210 [Pseudomonadota bacterium]|nr:hypothetical protein [Pseudomonadota bacterium]
MRRGHENKIAERSASRFSPAVASGLNLVGDEDVEAVKTFYQRRCC